MTTRQYTYQFIFTHATVNGFDGFKDGNTNPNLNDYEYDDNDFRVKKIENLFCEESERSSMILDRNKGITEIKYNHLNLPTKITWSNTKYINYQYNAAGQKVSKTVRIDADSIKVVDYLDGFQYAGNQLQFFPTAEGYVRVNAAKLQSLRTYNYVYNHTDHLDERNQSTALIEVCERSSVRLSYSKDPKTGELEILEETEERGSRMPIKRRSHKTNNNEQNHSTSCANFDLEILNFQNLICPFGLKHGVYTAATLKDFRIDEMGTDAVPGGGMGEVALINVTQTEYQYKYNGKEWQDELGLNWYDYGWRNYMPDLGRWGNQDPLSEDFYGASPYNYVTNNPVSQADFDGRDFRIDVIRNDDGEIIGLKFSATVYIRGVGASEDRASELNKDFKEKYGKSVNVDGIDISMDVNYVHDSFARKDKLKAGENLLEFSAEDGISYIQGNIGTIYGKGENNRTIFHESFHFMGLTDRYDDYRKCNGCYNQGTPVHKGFENDIMGQGFLLDKIHYENWTKHAKQRTSLGNFLYDSKNPFSPFKNESYFETSKSIDLNSKGQLQDKEGNWRKRIDYSN